MAGQPQAPQVENNELDAALDKINNSGSTTFQWVIIGLLVVILLVAGFMMLSGDDNTDSDNSTDDPVEEITDDNTPTVEPSEAVTSTTPETTPTSSEGTGENTVPDGWQPIVNETYSYTAYRPNSYYYRYFGYSTLGIDRNAIPEAGEYAGEVTLNVMTGDIESVKNEWIADWLAIAENTESKSNGNWELVMGTIPESLPVPEQQVIAAFHEENGYVYIVDHRAEPANYNTSIFDQFYPALLFEALDQ